MSMITLAIQFAKQNYHVFPLLKQCQNGNNKLGTPLGWNHNRPDHTLSIPSTTDVEEVKSWSEYGDKLLGYGINPRDKRALILDVDVGGEKQDGTGGKQGAESLNKLVFDYGLDKANFIIQSKSGGLHLYYEYPENTTIVGLPIDGIPHIDIRTSNNFVVGPGSLGGKYKIKSGTVEAPLVKLPEKLVAIMPRKRGASAEGVETNIKTTNAFQPVITDFGIEENKPLLGEIPEIICKGERDNVLIRLIGSWVKAGHSRNNIMVLLRTAIDKCENSDELNIEDYVAKLETTMQKSSFSSKQPEPLQFFIDNAIYINSMDGVYQIPDRRYYIKGLDSLYAPHYYFVEKETATGTKKQEVSAFKAWKKSSKRKTAENIGYKPVLDHTFFDKSQFANVCNLYKPIVHVKLSKAGREKLKYPDIVRRFLVLCSYLFTEKYDLMIEWAAHQVQHPDQKLSFAPVMVSELRGVGKNLFFDLISSLVGRHNTAVYSSDTIMDGHNDHVLKNHLVLINESYVPITDKYAVRNQASMVEKIKMLITDSVQSVNPKFIAPFNTTSYVNYIFASNNLAAVPMEIGDRRFEIVIIDASKTLGPKFYGPLWEVTRDDEMASLMASEIYHYLMKIEIKTVNSGYTPADDIYKEMVRHAGRTDIEAITHEDLEEEKTIFVGDIVTSSLYLWYVLNSIDPNASQSPVKAVLKSFAKTITTQKLRGKPKRLVLKNPDYTIRGQYVPECRRKEVVFVIRNLKKWEEATSDEIRDEYMKNYNFTKGIDSDLVVNRSDRKNGKEVKIIPFTGAADV